MAWYYADGGERQGPFDDRAFQQLVQQGTVGPDTMVWTEGMGDWQPYGEVALSRSAPADPTGAAPAQDMVGLGNMADIGGLDSAGVGNALGGADPMAGLGDVGGLDTSLASLSERMCSVCGNTFSAADLVEIEGHSICGACKPVFLQNLKEGSRIVGVMDYAGFWIRFVAKFVDGMLVGVVNFIIGFIIGMGGVAASEEVAVGLQLLSSFVGFAINIAYVTYFIGAHGATPGKMVCRLKVVMDDGSPVTYGRAFGRGFAEILSGLICYIGYIMAGFDEEKRALHDHICATRVIRL